MAGVRQSRAGQTNASQYTHDTTHNTCRVLERRASAIPCLIAWSFVVHAAEGSTFGVVPYVCPEGLGGVCAVVGAWGNIGAVIWGLLFKYAYLGNFEQGYITMGYIIIASAIFTVFMRIKGQSSIFCGE